MPLKSPACRLRRLPRTDDALASSRACPLAITATCTNSVAALNARLEPPKHPSFTNSLSGASHVEFV
jgi:hypothetical protein